LSFPGILDQHLATSVLEASLATDHFPSFLFVGPAGVGKRTLALTFAQAINCRGGAGENGQRSPGGDLFGEPDQSKTQDPKPKIQESAARPCGMCLDCRQIANLAHPDVRLIMPLKPEGDSGDDVRQARDRQKIVDETMRIAQDYALGKSRPITESKWQISIHVIHWLRSEMAYAPIKGRRRVVIVVDADQMNPLAANAFLKTLEEPQKDTTFILVTERGHKLLDTIRSRCQSVPFSFLKQDQVVSYLTGQKEVTSEQALIASELSGGSLRRALDYLVQPGDFLLPEAVDFFVLPQPTIDQCRLLADQADRLPLEGLIDSFIFLFGQALHASLNLPAHFARRHEAVQRRISSFTPGHIQRRLEVLLQAKREFEYNVNRRLFLFALLTTLAEPGRVVVAPIRG
jgi:DNA polymerase III subunit delta'